MIRAIACILVVLTHSITNYLDNIEVDLSLEGRYIIWVRFAILCATPIFIILSETLISKNYPNKLPKGFFIKRVKYILIPYLLMGLIISYRDSEKNFSSFLEIAIEKIILGHWYGFFVIVIIQFYFLHWFMGKYLAKMNPIIPILTAFVISFTHSFSFAHIMEYKTFIITYYPLSFRTNILVWLFYFVVAYYLGRYYEEIIDFLSNKVWIPVVAVLGSYLFMMFNIFERGYSMIASDRYDMLFYSVSVFFLLLIVIRKFSLRANMLIMISNFSYFIYLSHMVILPFYAGVSLGFSSNFFTYIAIMTFLTIATSIGWAFLFYKNGATRLLTGKIKYLDRKDNRNLNPVSDGPEKVQ